MHRYEHKKLRLAAIELDTRPRRIGIRARAQCRERWPDLVAMLFPVRNSAPNELAARQCPGWVRQHIHIVAGVDSNTGAITPAEHDSVELPVLQRRKFGFKLGE